MQVSELFFSYKEDVDVLSNISFQFYNNEILSIIGKSGCGKTTLLNLIAGLLLPIKGKISKDGQSLAYLNQKPVLLTYRNSFENALLGIELRNNYDKDTLEKLTNLFELFELNESKNLFPHELSGGMKQRVGIAQTLITESDLYLFDEPFNAIDRNTMRAIEKIIYLAVKSSNSAAIIVTHDIEQALLMSDRIIMLSSNPGTIVFDKSYPEDFRKIEPSLRKNHPDFNVYLLEIVKEFSEL